LIIINELEGADHVGLSLLLFYFSVYCFNIYNDFYDKGLDKNFRQKLSKAVFTLNRCLISGSGFLLLKLTVVLLIFTSALLN